ncbi:MAG: class II aldolase/adducin family protein, partial [Myxococcales bacterium]|nr:class II aldolase/adducin family protein [Myxococcales bacterium]
MSHLLALAELPALSDIDMMRELRVATLDPAAPAPSVEAILHAILPQTFVDHTHADAVVTVTNTPEGEATIRAIYGERVVIVPYVMPGFELAVACREALGRAGDRPCEGMVLLSHGIFTWGSTAKESYERMIELVDLAEQHVAKKAKAWSAPKVAPEPIARAQVAALRRAI